MAWAESNDAVVVSKDSDFRSLQLLVGRPGRLLVVATGNIRTSDLLNLVGSRLKGIVQALGRAGCVELHPTMWVIDTHSDDVVDP